MPATLELLIAGLLAVGSAQSPVAPQPDIHAPLAPGDRVDVTDDRHTIRGRIAELTSDSLVLVNDDGRRRLLLPSVQLIDAPQPSQAPAVQPSRTQSNRFAPTVFGRVGWARLTDDEGSLGDGTTVGVGIIVPVASDVGFWRSVAVQIAYDRHDHRRDLESGAPPGIVFSGGGFTGTEQLVTAKALYFFREDAAVRPYAGIGVGFLDSERQSEFPTFVLQPGNMVVPGPSEIFRYHTTGAGLGFAAGVEARMPRRLSLLGDLTLDLNQREALGSTRLTVGAGWRF